MTPNTAFDTQARALFDRDDAMLLAKHYIDGWATGQCSTPIPDSHFCFAFRHPQVRAMVVDANGRPSLTGSIGQLLSASAANANLASLLDDSDLIKTVRAYSASRLEPAPLVTELVSLVEHPLSAEDARKCAANAISMIAETYGVATSRQLFHMLINSVESEDVHRGAIGAAARLHLLLPHEVLALPLRDQHYWNSEVKPWRGGHTTREWHRDAFGHLHPEASGSLAQLVEATQLVLSANRKDYDDDEWSRLREQRSWAPSPWLIDYLERRLPFPVDRLLRDLVPGGIGVVGESLIYAIPVLRLLHMKALLQTPYLRSSQVLPEGAILIEILQVLTGNAPIQYGGKLRFSMVREQIRSDVRRRMAEAIAEALAVLFLEDAVGLQLSTLQRIPESSETSPDFRARANQDRLLVIESKGASTWEYFRSSLAKAKQQLGKAGSDRNYEQRAFVCRTFVASRDDGKESQFAADDPPVDVGRYFGDERDLDAMRSHYAGVCLLAGFAETARTMMEPERRRRSESREARQLIVGGRVYSGTAHRLAELGDLFGVELPLAIEELWLFRGIEQSLHQDLMNGRIRPRGGPSSLRGATQRSVEDRQAPPSGVGILPYERGDGRGRGVYSVMTDGSILAITGPGLF